MISGMKQGDAIESGVTYSLSVLSSSAAVFDSASMSSKGSVFSCVSVSSCVSASMSSNGFVLSGVEFAGDFAAYFAGLPTNVSSVATLLNRYRRSLNQTAFSSVPSSFASLSFPSPSQQVLPP